MMIPHNIHLIYESKEIPNKYIYYFNKIISFHKDWNITIYDDKMASKIVQENFPKFFETYNNYSLDIMRTDVFRILIVYLLGGFYLDLDMLCYKPLNDLCSNSLVLGEERVFSKKEMNIGHYNHSVRIANYMFGSIPKHPFWTDCIKELHRKSNAAIYTEEDVLETTGPGLLTGVYHNCKRKYPCITLLSNQKICAKWCNTVSCHFGEYAAHMHLGSWRWE